jgi:hypothetical protein
VQDPEAVSSPGSSGQLGYRGSVPRQNRVTPLGDLVVSRERGLVYGNRGCLHDETGAIRRRYATKRWIACRLQFRDRRRSPLMARGRYTELFFLDEATALAAGHRPCAECRRADYNRLTEIWSELHGGRPKADSIDDQLHAERLVANTGDRRFHELPYASLPDGTFVLHAGMPCLVLGKGLLPWSPGGYREAQRRPAHGLATLITPPSLVTILQLGWGPVVPLLHPSATGDSAVRRERTSRSGWTSH